MSLISDARACGIPVTIDPGSAAFLARLAPGEFLSWTSGAAVCFPNLDEAAVLTGEPGALAGEPGVLAGEPGAQAGEPAVLAGEPDPAAMAASLTKHYGLVALKLGGGGCVLAVPGEEPVRVAAEPVPPRDTTGAGDAFCAAFLSRWLAGQPPADAAGFAVRIAATAVSALGGRPPEGAPPEGASPVSDGGAADGGVPAEEQRHRQQCEQAGKPLDGERGEEVTDAVPAVHPADDQ